MATVFKRKGGTTWVIQYFDATGRRREKSSRTTDFRTAERIANKLEADVALRREGVIDGRQDRFTEEERKPLSKHVEDYLEYCRGKGVAKHTAAYKQHHLRLLMRHTGATRLSDLTLDVVERTLASFRNSGAAARTINTRRETFRAFGNWCRKTRRLGTHPLELLTKVDEHGDRRRIRRPLSDDELARLLEVAESRGRRGWYLMAALAGLRRSELIRLTWASVDLERGVLTIRDGKAKREDVLQLHPELIAELSRMRPADAVASTRVFPTEVTNLTRKKDFARARIDLVDAHGHVADLHSLRGTLGTRLARAGIAPQVAQKLMRHADYRTTLNHYTMLSLADTMDAMKRLPGGGTTCGVPSVEPGPPAKDSQQIPQHSGHEPARTDATTCVEVRDTPAPRRNRKPVRSGKLRDAAQPDATARDEDEVELAGTTSGLGTDCSILLSYGRAVP
jgi:integrase